MPTTDADGVDDWVDYQPLQRLPAPRASGRGFGTRPTRVRGVASQGELVDSLADDWAEDLLAF